MIRAPLVALPDVLCLYNKLFVNVLNELYPCFHMALSRFILPLNFLSASSLYRYDEQKFCKGY